MLQQTKCTVFIQRYLFFDSCMFLPVSHLLGSRLGTRLLQGCICNLEIMRVFCLHYQIEFACHIQYLFQLITHIITNAYLSFRDISPTCFGP